MYRILTLTFVGLLSSHTSAYAQFSSEGAEALRRINAKRQTVSTATYRRVDQVSPRLIIRGADRQAELDRAVATALAKFKASMNRVPATTRTYTQYRGLNSSSTYSSRNHCFGTRYIVPRIYLLGGPGGRIIVSPQVNCLPGRAPYRYYGVNSGPCGTSVVIIKR